MEHPRFRHKCNGSWKDYGSLLCSSCRSHEEVEDNSLEFVEGELKALHLLARHAAANCGGGEDIAGAITYTGGFRFLKDEDLVSLARDLEACGSLIDSNAEIVKKGK